MAKNLTGARLVNRAPHSFDNLRSRDIIMIYTRVRAQKNVFHKKIKKFSKKLKIFEKNA